MKRSKSHLEKDFFAIQDLFRSGQDRSRLAVHAAMLETYLAIGAILSRKFREEGWTGTELRELSDWLSGRTGSKATFTATNLEYMLHFHEAWSAEEDLLPLLPELPWSSHQVLLNHCRTREARRGLLEQAVNGKWTRQELEERVG